jgi:hypothetical protein
MAGLTESTANSSPPFKNEVPFMKSAQLAYSILCDDVRLEMGNKLSLMGIFENVYLPSFPAVLLRFAAVNHWIGAGDYQTQVRVVSPEGREVAQSAQSTFRIEPDGYADNVTFFANVQLERAGRYSIQTFIDGKMVAQRPLFVGQIPQNSTTLN